MDGDNLKLKYIIKKSIRIQMRQCRVVLYSVQIFVKRNGVYIGGKH